MGAEEKIEVQRHAAQTEMAKDRKRSVCGSRTGRQESTGKAQVRHELVTQSGHRHRDREKMKRRWIGEPILKK